MKNSIILAVTGLPILHSKSPVMFNRVFHFLGTSNSHTYTRLAVSQAKDAIYLMKELDIAGLNVTAPFKKEIIPYLDEIEPSAALIGGVNTIVNHNGKLKGFNTDTIGVSQSFQYHGIDIKGKRCIVLGAGGAGRAALYTLVQAGAHVYLVNRTFAKAQETTKTLGGIPREINTLPQLLKETDILISTLSASLDIIDTTWLKKDLIVFDANYKKSPLSLKAQECGCIVLKGEEWLLNQALPAYSHFLNQKTNPAIQQVMRDSLHSPTRSQIKNIALVGFMGCGKTTIGRLLAKKINYTYIDIDQLIEEQEHYNIPSIFSNKGEPYFRQVEKSILNRELANRTQTVFCCGGGAVLDDENKNTLQQHALTVWLYSSIDVTLQRLKPGTRPLLDCPDPGNRARELLKQRLIHYARAADILVLNENHPHSAMEKIYDEINQTIN